MVQAIAAFLDFCYIVHQSTLDEADLAAMENALTRFETERIIFEEVQICPGGISIPHIHALQHYQEMVQQFGVTHQMCLVLWTWRKLANETNAKNTPKIC